MNHKHQIVIFAKKNNFIDKCLENSTMWVKSSNYCDSTTLFNVLLKSVIDKTSVEATTSKFINLPSADTVLA